MLADSSEVSGTSGNVLDGDLTQLVEKLHQLETGRLRQFVEDLHTALREVALEPSEGLSTDVAASPVISTVPPSPDEIEHLVAEIAGASDDRLATDVAMASVISAVVSPSYEIENAAVEIAFEPRDRLGSDVATTPVSSAQASSSPDEIEHTEKVVALRPSDRLGTDVKRLPVVSAPVSSPAEKIGHATEHPSIIGTPPSTSIPNARRSSARGRSRWGERTALLLAVSAATASILWEWPVLFANLPQLTSVSQEIVVGRDAPEPSQRGEVAKEIVPIEGAVAPAAQAPSQPSEEIAPIEGAVAPAAQAPSQPSEEITPIEGAITPAAQAPSLPLPDSRAITRRAPHHPAQGPQLVDQLGVQRPEPPGASDEPVRPVEGAPRPVNSGPTYATIDSGADQHR